MAPIFSDSVLNMHYKYQDLIQLFNDTFYKEFNTRLIKGGDEPLYLPANALADTNSSESTHPDKDSSAIEARTYHQIIFARGYYASAFHEISHWCQAGEARRLLEDFGYWYQPDGRNELEQKKFEQVEVIPQAIEWAFNAAAQRKFHVSSDNLNGFQADTNSFQKKVFQQVNVFLEQGFPARANQFIEVLAKFYNTPLPLTIEHFSNNKEEIYV
jgi:elongation factor P hydroxylase